MPGNITHMYIASRLAEDFSPLHKNDTIVDINKGIRQWIAANRKFSINAMAAKNKQDSAMMQKVMDTYRAELTTDEVAVFSAFAAGSQGPDLWVLPHGVWDSYHRRVTGSTHFDLGHYNMTHAFPRAVLERLRIQADKLPVVQRKYQTAYILGYISHIALDITAHIKVNVFAAAYFQQKKERWENEHGKLWVNIFNQHNKIEHFFDSFIRFVCFEGYYTTLDGFSSIRTDIFGQKDLWNFPNYTDFWKKELKFGKWIPTDGIYDSDTVFLDNSTSLPGPFTERYYLKTAGKQVIPFIHADFLRAYGLCDDHITGNVQSIAHLPNELTKLNFYRMSNNSDFTSQYYLIHWVYPDIERVKAFTNRFYDPSAFAQFAMAGKMAGTELIDHALAYLDNGDTTIFEALRNWNLDIGLAIRIKDTSWEIDPKFPKKPPRPVTIDLVNVIDEIKSLATWKPPVLDAKKRYKNKMEGWKNPKKTTLNPTPGALIPGSSGTPISAVLYSQSGIDLKMSGFKLYVDTDELAGYLWGEPVDPFSVISVPDDKHGYHISACVEDFMADDAFTSKKDRKSGNATVKEFRSTFLGNIPPEKTASGLPANTIMVSEYGLRPLPRTMRVSYCRKYTFQPTDSGNFSPDLFKIYSNPFPTEEFCFALFVFIKNSSDYIDLFSHARFTESQVAELKHIKQIGVNTLLFLMARDNDSAKPLTRLKLLEAYVDGELQNVKADAMADVPAVVWRVEFEDAHFRTGSAVIMPDSLVYKRKTETTTPDLNEVDGLSILQVIYIQAKENPAQKLLITGHTDRVGDNAHNLSLSADRSYSVCALLQGKKDDWRMLADRQNHPDDISQILAWIAGEYGWNCHPVVLEGTPYAKKVAAIKKFQKRYNIDFIKSGKVEKLYPGTGNIKIDEDGDCGPQTWGAVYDVFVDAVAKKCSSTYENMKSLHDMFTGRWVEDANRTVPCGEAFPREKPEEDEFESPVNRRVEVLFFDPSEVPKGALPCNSTEILVTQTATTKLSSSGATVRLQNCTSTCPVYRGKATPVPIPVTPHNRPQTKPEFWMPEFPGSKKEQLVDGLIVYFSYYEDSKTVPVLVRKFRAKKGKLYEYATDKEVTVDGERETYTYVSHREDLDTSDRNARFSKDKSGLPLAGPTVFACGESVKVSINIWDQNDWVVVKDKQVEGKSPDTVLLADWHNDYSIGYPATETASGKKVFVIYGDPKFKQSQETWNYNPPPIELPVISDSNGERRWVGTVSAQSTKEIKLLLGVKRSSGGYLYAGSFNELKIAGKNIKRSTFHTYDDTLVQQLCALKIDEDRASAVDALKDPPARFILPGDICWHDQKSTNFCGAFSFAGAMNYWFPYTNNFDVHDGIWYSDTSRIPSIINGARTPSDISDGAVRFNMHTRESNADGLDKDHALKLLKLWVSAGVPMLVLVEEMYGLTSLHWKVVVGYDGNRIFYVNSGADDEYYVAKQTAGVDYSTAPTGNDIDTFDAFYAKWKCTGSFFVGGVLATSVDPCVLMPLFPEDLLFKGAESA